MEGAAGFLLTEEHRRRDEYQYRQKNKQPGLDDSENPQPLLVAKMLKLRVTVLGECVSRKSRGCELRRMEISEHLLTWESPETPPPSSRRASVLSRRSGSGSRRCDLWVQHFSDGVNPPKATEGSEKNYFYQKHCELRLTGTRNENEGRWQAPRK